MTFRNRNVVLSCLDSGKKNNCDPLKVIDHPSGPSWGTYFQLNPFETNKVGIAFTLTAEKGCFMSLGAGRVRDTRAQNMSTITALTKIYATESGKNRKHGKRQEQSSRSLKQRDPVDALKT